MEVLKTAVDSIDGMIDRMQRSSLERGQEFIGLTVELQKIRAVLVQLLINT